jgi:hypothetical protein
MNLERGWEWAKQNPGKVYGWAAETWDGVPDLREKEGSFHMIPVVPCWYVIELEDEVAALKVEIAALRSNGGINGNRPKHQT